MNTLLLLVVVLMVAGKTSGFAVVQHPHKTQGQSVRTSSRPNTELSMIRIADIAPNLVTMMVDDVIPMTIETITEDPMVEAEILTDVSHVAMDFSCLFGLSRSILQLFSIAGRLIALYADYLPDHHVHPEELAIQVFFLGLSLKDSVQLLFQQQPTLMR